jgi:Ankyrin repeats (3 copies)/Ankyrin repeat
MSRIASRTAFLASLVVGVFGLLNPAAGADWSLDHPGPFQPQLVTNKAPICRSLLPDVRAAYLSNTPLVGASYPPSILFGALTDVPDTTDQNGNQVFVQPGGTRFFTNVATLPGCGGACEGSSVLVSLRPIPASVAAGGRAGPDIVQTPGRGPWGVYRDRKGYYYLVGVVDDQLQIFLITPPGQWQTTCAFSLAPPDLSKSSDAATRAAVLAIDQLNAAALSLEGAESDCGTMNTRGRWAEALDEELKEAVYRPAAVEPPSTANSSSANSYGDYPRIADALADWSVGGIWEFHTFQTYQSALHRASEALSALYTSDYGLVPARSTALAEERLRNALSYGFGFYQYESFSDDAASFRRIILEHRSLAELPSAPLSDPSTTLPGRDPLMSLAVEYPAAVRLLLKHGADPNTPNEFGKTPLMYAAQYNQLESAKLLLEAGANPNAVTIQPTDNCQYSISRTNVTALDYAARYGSAALIKLLVAHGAATNIRSMRFGGVAGYPLDWLDASTASGLNSNIKASEVPELEKLLKPSSHSQKAPATRLPL